MGYHVDDRAMTLADLGSRIASTDLIPSHRALLDGLPEKLASLGGAGVGSVADLRRRLRGAASQQALAAGTGIDPGYLTLLRRFVEGFFPRPRPLTAFDGVDGGAAEILAEAGVTDTRQLFEAASAGTLPPSVEAGPAAGAVRELVALADLSRVQWVSPATARALLAAGYDSAPRVADADPPTLRAALDRANEGSRFFRGRIGLRDVDRLVTAAGLLR